MGGWLNNRQFLEPIGNIPPAELAPDCRPQLDAERSTALVFQFVSEALGNGQSSDWRPTLL